jgi:biopolymer transport protein ExbB/TolQ
MDMSTIITWTGNACYGALAIVALWGAFGVIIAWRRIGQIRFRNEQEQNDFLEKVDESLLVGDFKSAAEFCEGDRRAVPQLISLAIANRETGYVKVRDLMVERFQRDVLADLEHQLSWVITMIKSAPMLGLYGTVLGMMGAFDALAVGEKVDPKVLAENIALALITTALGLTIAIPLIICMNSLNVRIRKMEDLVGAGLTRFLEVFKLSLAKATGEEK